MFLLKYLQLPFYFDSIRLQAAVQLLDSSSWIKHHQHLHYEGEWVGLPLRSVAGDAGNIIISPLADTPYEDTIFLKESPYIQEILSHFKCPLRAVRLLKLKAGAVIKEHRDAELCFEKGEIRLHIPVITHEEVEFYLDQERMQLAAGECWYMNFNLPHHIRNNSPVNRVHLVIDAVVNDWVKELFASPAILIKKEVEDVSDIYSDDTKKQMIYLLRQMNTAVSIQMADDLEKELSLTPTI